MQVEYLGEGREDMVGDREASLPLQWETAGLRDSEISLKVERSSQDWSSLLKASPPTLKGFWPSKEPTSPYNNFITQGSLS